MPLAPGRIALYSAESPFRLHFDDAYHYVVAEVPSVIAFRDSPRLAASLAEPGLGETRTARMFSDLLRGVAGDARRMPLPLRQQLGDTMVGLLVASLDDVAGAASSAPARGILDVMTAWIEAHLADADLSPQRVAAAAHTSVRYVHKLFHEQGTTLGEYVRARRVERIKHDLLAPELAAWPVADIGARSGVHDATTLGRMFRAVEGTTPAAWRRRVSAAAGDR